jgi:hypothetical protein
MERVRDRKVDASSIHFGNAPEPERIVYASLAGALVGQVV